MGNVSLPSLGKHPVAISVLRIDCDMYEGYLDVLFNLYDRIPVGGFVIVDDYAIEVARRAVRDFRTWHGIESQLWRIDFSSVYWQKELDRPVRGDMFAYFQSLRVHDRR